VFSGDLGPGAEAHVRAAVGRECLRTPGCFRGDGPRRWAWRDASRRALCKGRLEGGPPAVYGLIKPTFDRLAEQRSDEDVSRPSIEFYRRHDMITSSCRSPRPEPLAYDRFARGIGQIDRLRRHLGGTD
jgi:hypothetical protein